MPPLRALTRKPWGGILPPLCLMLPAKLRYWPFFFDIATAIAAPLIANAHDGAGFIPLFVILLRRHK
jgi:hypothetical protein